MRQNEVRKGHDKAFQLDQIHATLKHDPTGWDAFDAVMGGGFATVSDRDRGKFSLTYLLGGTPGVGKTTMLSKMIGIAGNSQKRVDDGNGRIDFLPKKPLRSLYISTEEHVAMLAARFKRLGDINDGNVDKISFAHTNKTPRVVELTNELKPDILIIDAIQELSNPNILGTSGGKRQEEDIRESMYALTQRGVHVILVGHSTKVGKTTKFQGSQHLKHMVDATLWMKRDEIDVNTVLFFAEKHRAASVDIEASFKMIRGGLTLGDVHPRVL